VGSVEEVPEECKPLFMLMQRHTPDGVAAPINMDKFSEEMRKVTHVSGGQVAPVHNCKKLLFPRQHNATPQLPHMPSATLLRPVYKMETGVVEGVSLKANGAQGHDLLSFARCFSYAYCVSCFPTPRASAAACQQHGRLHFTFYIIRHPMHKASGYAAFIQHGVPESTIFA
jgi:hypothetical protein